MDDLEPVAPSMDTVDDSKGMETQQMMSYYKSKGNKNNPGPSDDDYLIHIDGGLKALSENEVCTKRTDTGTCQCSCLHVL